MNGFYNCFFTKFIRDYNEKQEKEIKMKIVQKISVLILTVVVISSTPMCYSQEHEVITHKTEPTKLIQCIHQPAYRLFQWPDRSVLEGPKIVNSDSNEVARPKMQCLRWLKKVIAPSWLPPEDIKMFFIRSEFDERDVVRMAWQRNDYNIQVSQTGSIFTIKLTPIGNKNSGLNDSQKIEKTKQLCLKVFTDKGKRWDNEGNEVPVNDLSKKIVSYSFDTELIRHLKDDKSMFGRPKTKHEAGVKSPQDDIEAIREKDPNNPNWDKTASSYRYWFRMVNWWNDGTSIGFYFLKVEEGSWIPSYWGNIDKQFFKIKD